MIRNPFLPSIPELLLILGIAVIVTAVIVTVIVVWRNRQDGSRDPRVSQDDDDPNGGR